MTATQRRRLVKIEQDKQDAADLLLDPSIEPTSNYGIRKIPEFVQIIALKYAVEQVRKIHHQHYEDSKAEEQNDYSIGDTSDFDFHYNYNDPHGSENDSEEDKEVDDGYITLNSQREEGKADKIELFNVNDFKNALKDDAVDGLNASTMKKLEKQWHDTQESKYPVFNMVTNLTPERMQCVMIVAGVTAASCSLLSTTASRSVNKDVMVRVQNKMIELLNLAPTCRSSGSCNFFHKLECFTPANVKMWATGSSF